MAIIPHPSRYLCLCFGLALLLAGCGSSKTATPDLEPTIDVTTPVPQSTRVAAATPTPRPAATPRRNAPVPSVRPPTPTPAPSLSFNFGLGVDAGDRAIISNLISTSRRVLTAAGGGETACTVLAFDTLTGLSQAYSRLGAAAAARGPDVVRRLQNGVAEAGYRNVAIYTGGQFWHDADDVTRVQVVAHEYVHVVQLELEGEQLANQTFATPVNQAPPGGPFWLLEGSAEYISWLIVEDMRLGTLNEKLADYKQRAIANPVRLSDMENYVGYVGAAPDGIATATLGVAALLQGRLPSDLFQFWRQIGSGQQWQVAFASVFGRPVADFYATFDASR